MTTWNKIGRIMGYIFAMTMTVCAWLILIVFTLKILWFILFRILL